MRDPDPKRALITQMSNEQKPGCLGCIGDEFLKREDFFPVRLLFFLTEEISDKIS